MSLLSICQGVARRLSINVPASIVTNTSNTDAMLLWELANVEGYMLSQRAEWQQLRKEHSFTTLAADDQGATSIPDDFEFYCNDSMFDRTSRRPVRQFTTPAEWQEYKTYLLVPADPTFIVRGSNIFMAPLQGAGNSVYYEYISKKWARSSGAAEQTEFLADTDTTVFDEMLVKQGVLWRYKEHKGLPHENDQFVYEKMVADKILRNGIRPRLQAGDVNTPHAMKRGKAFIQDYNTIGG